jgi:hypothetical protein
MLFHKMSGYEKMRCYRYKKYYGMGKFYQEPTEYYSRCVLSFLGVNVVHWSLVVELMFTYLAVGGRCLGDWCKNIFGAVDRVGEVGCCWL